MTPQHEARGRRSPGARSLFETPLAAFHAQAAVAAKVHPALAGFMADLATYARCIAERTVRENARVLTDVLRRMGLERPALEKITGRLHAGHLPFAAALACESSAGRLAELLGKKQARRTSAFPALQALLRHCNRETFPGDAGERGEPIEDRGRRRGGPNFAMVASLDRPGVVTKNTYSGVNIEPATSAWDRDDIIATEITYLGDVYTGYWRDDAPARAPMVPPGYRTSIEKDLPDGFAEKVKAGWNNKQFVFALREVNRLVGASLVVDLLVKNKDKIKDAIDKLADKAGKAAESYAAAHGLGPVAKQAGKLAEEVVQQGLSEVYDLVLDLLDGSAFDLVTISHFVDWQPGQAPESTFTLSTSGSGPLRLYAIERDTSTPNTSKLVTSDDGKSPSYSPFGAHEVAFMRKSRFMRGVSHDPARPAPADLWRKTGAQKEASVWADASRNEGFHVLVSVKETDGEGLYVWGLRADVRRNPDEYL
ncbi:MAG TPA: hypothetical protein VF211_07680 [Burkholderiales bacterium]